MEAIKKENNVTVLNHNQYFKSVNCAGLPLLLHIWYECSVEDGPDINVKQMIRVQSSLLSVFSNLSKVSHGEKSLFLTANISTSTFLHVWQTSVSTVQILMLLWLDTQSWNLNSHGIVGIKPYHATHTYLTKVEFMIHFVGITIFTVSWHSAAGGLQSPHLLHTLQCRCCCGW